MPELDRITHDPQVMGDVRVSEVCVSRSLSC